MFMEQMQLTSDEKRLLLKIRQAKHKRNREPELITLYITKHRVDMFRGIPSGRLLNFENESATIEN